ncbi:hypothetical protein KM043_005350 [Ampulex compressa]|nr:hypothetical protein KM043_005350 [Ampulex compressa]
MRRSKRITRCFPGNRRGTADLESRRADFLGASRWQKMATQGETNVTVTRLDDPVAGGKSEANELDVEAEKDLDSSLDGERASIGATPFFLSFFFHIQER